MLVPPAVTSDDLTDVDPDDQTRSVTGRRGAVPHMTYNGTELGMLGRWAANQITAQRRSDDEFAGLLHSARSTSDEAGTAAPALPPVPQTKVFEPRPGAVKLVVVPREGGPFYSKARFRHYYVLG